MHLQTRMARASQQIDRHARNADNGDDSALLYSALLWRCLFFTFCYVKSSACDDAVHFFDISQLPKVRRTPSSLHNSLKCKASSRHTVLCICFADDIPRWRPAPAETETVLRRPRKPLYPKKHKVSCQECFSPVNAHVCDSMTIDHDMMT